MGRQTNRRIHGGLGLGIAVALCFGCTTARVENVKADRAVTLPRPGRVVVFDLDVGASDVRVGRSPLNTARNAVGLYVDEPDVLAAAVADSLASKLVDDIKALGLSAERAAKATPPELNDLVIQGQFVRIDEGSQTRRFVIGFGVGATDLRTQVQMFQVTADGWRPVKQFDTVSTGSRFPGAAFFIGGGAAAGAAVATSAMISSGVGVIREVRASIDANAGSTSEQIAGKVSELSTANRW
jgi:Domain of unknown function (DUF4410)